VDSNTTVVDSNTTVVDSNNTDTDGDHDGHDHGHDEPAATGNFASKRVVSLFAVGAVLVSALN
jgi:hypothetical protein